jgi:hypothetical protein
MPCKVGGYKMPLLLARQPRGHSAQANQDLSVVKHMHEMNTTLHNTSHTTYTPHSIRYTPTPPTHYTALHCTTHTHCTHLGRGPLARRRQIVLVQHDVAVKLAPTSQLGQLGESLREIAEENILLGVCMLCMMCVYVLLCIVGRVRCGYTV